MKVQDFLEKYIEVIGEEYPADDYRFYHPWQEEAYQDEETNEYFSRHEGDVREAYPDNPYGESFEGDNYTKYTAYSNIGYLNIEGYEKRMPANGPTPGIKKSDYDKKEYDITSLNYVSKYFDVRTDNIETVYETILNEVVLESFRPIDGGTNDAGNDNEVSYVDPVGKYMQVKDVKKLMLFGKEYNIIKDKVETKNIDNQVVTRQYYRAVGEGGNDINIKNPNYTKNSGFNLSDIKIYVETSDEYDTGESNKIDTAFDEALHISIPSSALPIQLDTISLDEENQVESFVSATGDAVLPIRIAYTVGISDDIMTDGKVDLTKVSKEYLEANKVGSQLKNAEKDYVYFYSNYYSAENYDNDGIKGTTHGNAATTYTASPENRFYVYQGNFPIYKTIEGDNGKREGELEDTGGKVTLADEVKDMTEIESNLTYYIPIEYYDPVLDENGKQEGNQGKLVQYAISCKGSDLIQGNVRYVTYYDTQLKKEVTSKGRHTIVTTKIGGKRVTNLNKLTVEKGENKTNTATYFYAPTYGEVNNAQTYSFVNYMGNNGRISIEDSLLRIAKKIDKDIPKEVKEYKDFKFKVYLEGAEGIKNVILVEWDGTDWKNKIDKVTVTTNNDGYILDTSGNQTEYWAGNTEEQRTVDADGMITVYRNSNSDEMEKISVYQNSDGVTPIFKLTTLFKTKELVFNDTDNKDDVIYGVAEFTLKSNEAISLDKLSAGKKYIVEEVITDGEEGFTFSDIRGELIDKPNKKILGEIHSGVIDEATFINTYKPISIKVTKIWDDENDEKQKRPKSVKLVLQSNGETVIDNTGKPAEVILSDENEVENNKNQWEYTFEDLPEKDKSGQEIIYSVKEQEVHEGDLFNYYRVIIEGNKTEGFTIINKLAEVTAIKASDKNESSVKKGDIIKYSVTVTCNVEGSKEVLIKDQIPAGTTFVSGSINIDPVQQEGKTYTLQDLTESGIKATVNLSNPVTLTFEVKVTGDGLVNGDYVKNSAEIVDGPNIKDTNVVKDRYKGPVMNATKTASIIILNRNVRDYAVEGNEIEYSIEVVNNGEAEGTAKITDQIPTGTTFVQESIRVDPVQIGAPEPYTLEDLTENGINVTLDAGETATITFRVKINKFNNDEGLEKTITNIAILDGEKEIPSDPVKVKKSHLLAQKTSSTAGNNVQKGSLIEYKITVINEGEVEGTAKIRDSIPKGTKFKEESIKIIPEERGHKNTFVEQDLITEGIEVTVPGGEIAEITFEVEVTGEGLKNGNKITNTALIEEDGQTTETETVEHNYIAPKFSSMKSAVIENESLGYAHEGETIKYEIEVSNDGGLEGVVNIKDQIPDGTEFVPDSIKINDKSTSLTKEDLTGDGININVLPKNGETSKKLKIMSNPPVVENLTDTSKTAVVEKLENGKFISSLVDKNINSLFTSYDSNLWVDGDGVNGENSIFKKGKEEEDPLSYSIEFTIDCKEFIIYHHSAYFRLYVDEGNGYEMTSYDGIEKNSGNGEFYSIKFETKKQRNIKIELNNRFYGIAISQNDTISKLNRESNPKALYLSDGMGYSSYIYDKGYLSYLNVISNILGYETLNNADTSIGYVYDDNGTRFKFREKLEAIAPKINPDIILFQGGRYDVVDGRYMASDVADEAGKCFEYVKNNCQQAKGIVIGVWSGETTESTGTEYKELNKLLREKALEYGLPFIDLLEGETISGNGKIITKEPTPYVTSEIKEKYLTGKYLTPEGHRYFGEKLAQEIYKALNNVHAEETTPVTLSFEVKVNPLEEGTYKKTITNIAKVNGKDTAQVDVDVKKSKIEATKTAVPENNSEVGKNEEITYSINVSNKGSEKKTFFVKDKIPAGTKFKEGSIKIKGKQDLTKDDQDLTTGIQVTLNAGESTKIEFTVIVIGEGLLNEKNIITNSAEVDGNFTDEVTHKYVKKAKISSNKKATIVDSPLEYAQEEETIRYEIEIKNNGDLDGVANIKDQIPEGTDFVPNSIKINDEPTSFTQEDLTGDGININVLPENWETNRKIKEMGKPPDVEDLNISSTSTAEEQFGNCRVISTFVDERVNDEVFTSYDSELKFDGTGIIGINRIERKDNDASPISYSVEFTIDCQEFLFDIKEGFRIYVDEGNGYEMVSYDGYTGHSSERFYKVRFDSKKQRNVKIELQGKFYSLIVHTDDIISKITRDSNPKALYLTDGLACAGDIDHANKGYLSYVNTISNILGFETYNSADDGSGYAEDHSGDGYTLLEKLKILVPKIKPDVIVLQAGRQDISRKHTVEEVINEAIKCFDYIKEKNLEKKVVVIGVWSGVPNTDSEYEELNKLLKGKALEYSLPYIDLLTGETILRNGRVITENPEPYVTSKNQSDYVDNDDLTEQGHKYMGEKLAEEIYKVLNDIQEEEKSPVTLSFDVKVKKLDKGVYEKTIENTAIVNEVNTNTVQTEVKKPHIQGTKNAIPAENTKVIRSSEITYLININNPENETRTILVKDKIPTGTKFKEGSIKIGDKSEPTQTEEDLVTNGIQVTLEPGKSTTVEFKVTVTGDQLENEQEIVNTAEVDGELTNEVKHIYIEEEPQITSNIEKNADIEKIDKENQEITYKIKYKVTIDKYVGDAKLTLVDTLPFKLTDTSKSEEKLNGGRYSEDTDPATITWEEQLTGINTYTGNGLESVPYERTIEKQITISYKDLDVTLDKITNNVKGTLELLNSYIERNVVTAKEDVLQEYLVNVKVIKSWEDNNNQSGKRPTMIKVKLYAKGVLQQTVDVNGAADQSNWEYIFKNLKKYDESGNIINYRIDEENTGSIDYNKTSVTETLEQTEEGYVGTIVNTLEEEKKGSLQITKMARTKEQAEAGELGDPLPGVEFRIYRIDDDSIDLTVPEKYVKTEEGEYQKPEGDSKWYTESGVTGVGGVLKFEDLPLGRYLVEEVSGPDYVVERIPNFIIDIPMTKRETQELIYDVEVVPKNEVVYGSVALTKEGPDGEKLRGVTFKLQREEAKDTWVDYPNSTQCKIRTKENGTAIVSALPTGKYRFVEIGLGLNEGYILDNKSGYEFIVSINSSTKETIVQPSEITIINDKPTVEKTVESYVRSDDKNNNVEANQNGNKSFDKGDTITYKVEVDVPKAIADLNVFTISDTMDSNLDYKEGTLKVKAYKKADGEVEEPDTEMNLTEIVDYTLTLGGEDGKTWIVDFNDIGKGKLTDYYKIEITYEAIVLGTVEIETGYNNNSKLSYSTNVDVDIEGQPNDNSTEESEDNELIYTGGLKINKIEGKTNKKLSGAKFKIASSKQNAKKKIFIKDENEQEIEIETDAEGVAKYWGLSYGTYYLVEVQAPTDYNLLREPVMITIDAESYKAGNEVIVINRKGFELPETGGLGTILIIICGLAFIMVEVARAKNNRK